LVQCVAVCCSVLQCAECVALAFLILPSHC